MPGHERHDRIPPRKLLAEQLEEGRLHKGEVAGHHETVLSVDGKQAGVETGEWSGISEPVGHDRKAGRDHPLAGDHHDLSTHQPHAPDDPLQQRPCCEGKQRFWPTHSPALAAGKHDPASTFHRAFHRTISGEAR